MRSAALLALLPVLAAAAVLPDAHAPVRKSISYGPAHKHSSWELHPEQPASLASHSDPLKIAAGFISQKLGLVENEGFYIREDVSVHFDFATHPPRASFPVVSLRSSAIHPSEQLE